MWSIVLSTFQRSGHSIVVVGSGRLARSLCRSLASQLGSASVSVLARDGAAAAQLARASAVVARVSGTSTVFDGFALDDAEEVLVRVRPEVVVCCASEQSPYEKRTQPTRWTELIGRCGFGLTLPLQARIAARLARVLSRVSPETLLVNGCFPDAVNPLLHALGLRVLCGIGNVATLAACLQAALNLPGQRELAVLAHHAHLDGPREPDQEARAWLAGSPMPTVTGLLAGYRALPRQELNDLAGHAAARLLADLLRGEAAHTSVPGPLGLPGGYPVLVQDGQIRLNLPAGVSQAQAVEWNTRAGERDGISVRDGHVGYTPGAAEELARYLPDIAAGWPAEALDEVGDQLLSLRHQLRLAQPAAA
ncbi:hypothetical protein Rhe02_71220 [Rhizocola hellebori]|uniref:Potassium transporter TrkA n=1 Tax=Rhizocola hellebori TaxID=1392758 RepID=A0A8J3VJT7_9ACTN|nr:potassium transporter TrkA [Rhizocola hellebori]GIH09055.1 hypothetical protein Rhe02_71220 [Rhizocola hellebori]